MGFQCEAIMWYYIFYLSEYGRQGKHTFVDSVFGGNLISTVICEECTFVSTNVSSIQYIVHMLPSNFSLHQKRISRNENLLLKRQS